MFDGHGGMFLFINLGAEVSKYVERIFINILTNLEEYKKGDYKRALELTFQKVDEAIDSPQGAKELMAIRSGGEAKEGGSTSGSETGNGEKVGNACGCTANVLLITKDKYYVANAGDSRSALCRNGKTIQLSDDHKP